MSQGNLTYHFTKNDIVIALFHQLKEKSDRVIDNVSSPGLTPELFKKLLHENFNLLHHYRFLFLDFLNILREVDSLKKEYSLLNQKRRMQFHGILDALNTMKLLSHPLTSEEKDSLYTVFNIYFNFWLTDAEILYKGKPENLIPYYEKIALHLLSPYLNKDGKKAMITEA